MATTPKQFRINYFWRVMFNTLSLLCSLVGGECLDFLLRLIFAILSSPNTSPVLNAEMRSSNSALLPEVPFMDTWWFANRRPPDPLDKTLVPTPPSLQFLRSSVNFFNC